MKWVGILAVVALAAAVSYFLYLLFVSSDQTRLAILTAAVSVGTIVYTQNKNAKREIESRQFSKKAEAYEEVISSIASVFNTLRREEEIDQAQLTERLASIIPKMVIWAGPDVLQAWERLSSPGGDGQQAVVAGVELIGALRRELGHTNDAKLGQLGALGVMLKADAREELGGSIRSGFEQRPTA